MRRPKKNGSPQSKTSGLAGEVVERVVRRREERLLEHASESFRSLFAHRRAGPVKCAVDPRKNRRGVAEGFPEHD